MADENKEKGEFWLSPEQARAVERGHREMINFFEVTPINMAECELEEEDNSVPSVTPRST